MKIYTQYITPIALTPSVRRYRVALAAALALLVMIIGLLYVPGFSLSTTRPPAEHAVESPPQGLLAICRSCRDEVLAAQSKVAAQPVRVAPAVHTTTRALITNCRPCRDEALGANQASLATTEDSTGFSQLNDPRRSGPR